MKGGPAMKCGPAMTWHAEERGSATVLGVAIVLVLVSMLMLLSSAGAWLLAHARASSVADVAALAAARQGSCEAARVATALNRARLQECSWQGTDVMVVVAMQVTAPALPHAEVQAAARAGY